MKISVTNISVLLDIITNNVMFKLLESCLCNIVYVNHMCRCNQVLHLIAFTWFYFKHSYFPLFRFFWKFNLKFKSVNNFNFIISFLASERRIIFKMSKIKTIRKTSKSALEHSRSINYRCRRRNGLSHKENLPLTFCSPKQHFSTVKTRQGESNFRGYDY